MKIWIALTKPETRENMICHFNDLVVLSLNGMVKEGVEP
jgi:hypothetical protein